jgi:hypothetical protein
VVTDAATAGSCTSGSGTAISLCRDSGSAWVPLGDGGGAGAAYNQTVQDHTTSLTQRATVNAWDGLVAEDNSGNTRTDIGLMPYDSRVVTLNDDFVGTISGNSPNFQLGWLRSQGTGSFANAAAAGAWPNLGLVTLTPGNGGSNGGSWELGGTAPLGALGSNSPWHCVWVFKISTTSKERLRIGLGTGTGGGIQPASFIGLRYDTNSAFGDTAFLFMIRNASGTEMYKTSGVNADTNFHTLHIYSTTSGVIGFQLDAGTVVLSSDAGWSGTVVVPTVALTALTVQYSDDTSQPVLTLDFFGFKARVNGNTANKRQ